jgi:anti-sigma factor ChrR (cupin superfamily)
MIPEDVHALALADAIGALDAAEQRELQARVAALPPEVREQVGHLYDVALTVVASVDDIRPSAHVRDALMKSIERPSSYTLTAREGEWFDPGIPGLRVKILALDRERDLATLLIRAEPGARYPSHRHSAGEECYVLRGSIHVEGRILHAGDFHHADALSDHGELWTEEGAEVLLIASATDYLESR